MKIRVDFCAAPPCGMWRGAYVLDLLSLSSQKFHGRRRTSEKRREERERWSKMPLARPCMEHGQSTRKEGRWGKKHLLLPRPPSKQRHQREEDRQTVAVLLLLPPFDGRKTRARREGGKSSCWKKDPIDPSKNACPPFMKRSPDREMECLLNQTRHNKTTKARSTTGFVLMTMCQNVLLVWFFCLFSALRYVCEYHM